MAEWVRVKDKRTGHEYSVMHVNEKIHEVLKDKGGTRRNGKPLDAKPSLSGPSRPPAGEDDEEDLESLSVDELKNLAREEGVVGFSQMNKQQLVDALKGESE